MIRNIIIRKKNYWEMTTVGFKEVAEAFLGTPQLSRMSHLHQLVVADDWQLNFKCFLFDYINLLHLHVICNSFIMQTNSPLTSNEDCLTIQPHIKLGSPPFSSSKVESEESMSICLKYIIPNIERKAKKRLSGRHKLCWVDLNWNPHYPLVTSTSFSM